jgi:hypothetical protein
LKLLGIAGKEGPLFADVVLHPDIAIYLGTGLGAGKSHPTLAIDVTGLDIFLRFRLRLNRKLVLCASQAGSEEHCG